MASVKRWIVAIVDWSKRSSKEWVRVLLPAVAVLGAGAAVAIGHISSSGGTITACVNTVGFGASDVEYGTVRIIDPSNTTSTNPSVSKCDPTETQIEWNQQGPPGPPGPQGPRGPQGPPGGHHRHPGPRNDGR
jgi:hypothetical protein